MKSVLVIGTVIVLIGACCWVLVNSEKLFLQDSSSEDSIDKTEAPLEHGKDLLLDSHGDSNAGKEIKGILSEAEGLMVKFDLNNDPQYIAKAISVITKYTPYLPEEAIANRNALLQRLSSLYDPSYDTNPPPPGTMHVIPPNGYYVGVPPEEVEESDLREDYVNRIEARRKIVKIHKTQRLIRKLMNDVSYLYTIQNGGNIKNIDRLLQEQELPPEMINSMVSMAREAIGR